MKCLVCGHIIEEDSSTCRFCGAKLNDYEEDSCYQSFSEYSAFECSVAITRIRTSEVILIDEFPTVIGRSSKCDVKISGNPAISRRHLEINRVGEHVFVRDLKSRNHTYVDDNIVDNIQIIDDFAQLRLADEEFTIKVNYL